MLLPLGFGYKYDNILSCIIFIGINNGVYINIYIYQFIYYH